MKISHPWKTRYRIDFTYSMPTEREAKKATFCLLKALTEVECGWTLREGMGGWQGEIEYSRTLSIAGEPARDIWTPAYSKVFEALVDGGCQSVQVETWHPTTGYRCVEWKAEDEEDS